MTPPRTPGVWHGTHGVTNANAIMRTRAPGESPVNLAAEIAALLFCVGVVLGFAIGAIW